ncbi:MAG: DNA alkylation repair protein [Coriobacteriales bacterium]|jgi:3-methyladenine DNA glycosylase AlkD|nr:DNA alkylation repair protein [Coriobacteriales bacterium]
MVAGYKELFDVFEAAADAGQAARMAAYMKDQFAFLGIPTPKRKALARPFMKQAKKDPAIDWGFIEACWAKPEREFQYLACEYLKAKRDLLIPADMAHIEQMVLHKSWWDSIDALDVIAGGVTVAYPEAKQTEFAWSLSDNIWLRRMAIDHQLQRKETTDTELLAQVLENNLPPTLPPDLRDEFFINKAVGWALRDYSKTDPGWVRAFIDNHREQMARLSIKEGSKYL